MERNVNWQSQYSEELKTHNKKTWPAPVNRGFCISQQKGNSAERFKKTTKSKAAQLKASVYEVRVPCLMADRCIEHQGTPPQSINAQHIKQNKSHK